MSEDFAALEKELKEKLAALESAVTTLQENASYHAVPRLQWTASKTDLIELIYALYSGNVFNRGKTTIREITGYIEETFGVKLGNTSMTFQEILRRKESTAFIDRLKNKLELHITHIEEKNLR